MRVVKNGYKLRPTTKSTKTKKSKICVEIRNAFSEHFQPSTHGNFSSSDRSDSPDNVITQHLGAAHRRHQKKNRIYKRRKPISASVVSLTVRSGGRVSEAVQVLQSLAVCSERIWPHRSSHYFPEWLSCFSDPRSRPDASICTARRPSGERERHINRHVCEHAYLRGYATRKSGYNRIVLKLFRGQNSYHQIHHRLRVQVRWYRSNFFSPARTRNIFCEPFE